MYSARSVLYSVRVAVGHAQPEFDHAASARPDQFSRPVRPYQRDCRSGRAAALRTRRSCLLQEGIGVTPHLLRVAERLAAEDYLVLVPDLYSRDLARQALSEQEVVRGIPIARSPRRAELLAALSSR